MRSHKPSTMAAAIERIEMLEIENEQLNRKLSQLLVTYHSIRRENSRLLGNPETDDD